MIRCEQLPELCPDFHAGGLAEAEAELYRQHLASCAVCRVQDAEYRDGLRLLRSLPQEPSQTGDEQFLAELFAGMKQARAGAPVLQAVPGPVREDRPAAAAPKVVALRRSRPLLALALAASLLLALGAWLWLQPSGAPGAPEAPALVQGPLQPLEGPLPWDDLPPVGEQMLAAQLRGLEDGPAWLDPEDLDPDTFEEDLWSELAREDALDEPWLETELPALEEELGKLDDRELQQLLQMIEKG